MAHFRITIEKNNLGSKGQATVEYILLFVVVISLAATLFKSDAFQKIFGNDGKFAKAFREEMEYSYRHAKRGAKSFSQPNYNGAKHDSYILQGNTTRFFGAKDVYPK